MEALLDFGLVERIRGSEAGADITIGNSIDLGDEQGFTMHPVVHMWAMQIQDDTARDLSLHHAVLLFRTIPFDDFSFSGRQSPHTVRCSEWLMTLHSRGDHMVRKVLFDVLSVHAVQNIAWCLRSLDIGLLDRAIALVELLQEHVKCEVDDGTGDLLSCQRPAASGLEQSYICIPWTILRSIMDSHATFLRDAVQLIASEAKFRQTLELCTRLGGESHINTIKTLNELGMVLSEQSNCKESEAVLLRASSVLSTIQAAMRGSKINTEAARNALFLGELYGSMGQTEKAGPYLTQAIAASQEESSVHIYAKWQFAHLCFWNERLHEAEVLFLEILEHDLKVWGSHHQNTRTTELQLAYTYAAQGQEQEASNMVGRVFEHASHARIMTVLGSMTDRSYGLDKRGLDASCMEVILKRGWDEAFRIAQSYDRASLTEEEATTLSSVMRWLRHLYARQHRPEFRDMYEQMLLLDPWYLHTDSEESDGASPVNEDSSAESEEKNKEVGGSDGKEKASLEETNSRGEATQSSVIRVSVASADQLSI